MYLKKIINSFLNKFGFKIQRIRKNKPDIFEVRDPIVHNSLSRMNEYYSDKNVLAEYLTSNRFKFYSEILETLKNFGITLDSKLVADVGSGTGHFICQLMKTSKPKIITGLEFASEAIKRAKEICPEEIRFIEHNIYDEYKLRFDIVYCLEVLEHLEYPEKALKNLINMVNKNGHLIITVPNGRTDSYIGHINFWSPESWKIFIQTVTNDLKCDFRMLNNDGLVKSQKTPI